MTRSWRRRWANCWDRHHSGLGVLRTGERQAHHVLSRTAHSRRSKCKGRCGQPWLDALPHHGCRAAVHHGHGSHRRAGPHLVAARRHPAGGALAATDVAALSSPRGWRLLTGWITEPHPAPEAGRRAAHVLARPPRAKARPCRGGSTDRAGRQQLHRSHAVCVAQRPKPGSPQLR